MTTPRGDLYREKKYRYDEALSLGRTPEQAEKEVQAWIDSLNENTTQTEQTNENNSN